MESVADRNRSGRAGERGFALVVAILALLLLTFLGLTLAATTSTELQIAANHRWSQQAYYNAEAGLELGKRVLMTANWQAILWTARAAPVVAGRPDISLLPQRADRYGNPERNFENEACDPVSGVGYGVVLDDGTPGGPYQNISTWPDATTVAPCNPGAAGCWTLNGSFTLWVRYRLESNDQGLYGEDQGVIVLTSEGTAPYAGATSNLDFARRNRAVQVLEVALERFTPSRCGKDQTQVGADAAGSGLAGCTESPDTLRIQGGTAPPGASLAPGAAFDDRR